MAADGLITIASNFSAKETMDRLEAEIGARGMTVFARIDHAGWCNGVGLPLRPTELVAFGNARGWHTADAGRTDDRNRFAVKGTGF